MFLFSKRSLLHAPIADGSVEMRSTTRKSGGNAMPIFLFRGKVGPTAEVELKEVAAPDFLDAVQTLAAWRPGIHILKLEGVFTNFPAHA